MILHRDIREDVMYQKCFIEIDIWLYAVVGGVPAKVIKYLDPKEQKE